MKKDVRWVDPHQVHHYAFNWRKAYKYAKLMEEGIEFPPVRVHLDEDGKYVVRNGAHRTAAAKMVGVEILIEVATRHELEDYADYESGFKRR